VDAEIAREGKGNVLPQPRLDLVADDGALQEEADLLVRAVGQQH
jgi:hypothetical protein